MLNARTLLFPIIGDPVIYARSPEVLTRTFGERGINAASVPMQVKDGDLAQVLAGLTLIPTIRGLLVGLELFLILSLVNTSFLAAVAHGGAARANVFTRSLLALWGEVPWRAVPVMPVEIMLLPQRFAFNLYEVLYTFNETVFTILRTATLLSLAISAVFLLLVILQREKAALMPFMVLFAIIGEEPLSQTIPATIVRGAPFPMIVLFTIVGRAR